MNARTVTRLCKALFDDDVVSYTAPSRRIVVSGRGPLSRELRGRIVAVIPKRYPDIDYVPPCSIGLTPEEWTLILAMPETRTADSAVTTDFFVLIMPDGSSIYAHCHTL